MARLAPLAVKIRGPKAKLGGRCESARRLKTSRSLGALLRLLSYHLRVPRAQVAAQLTLQAGQFERLAASVVRRLTPDGVHDLRVLVRRIRAGVWLARRLGPGFDKLARLLRKMGCTLGERRLLDVAVLDAKTFGLDGTGLKERMDEAGRDVLEALGERLEIARRLRAASAGLGASTRDRIDEGITKRIATVRKAKAEARRGKAQLHRLRIELKKARYLIDALGGRGEFVKPVQDLVGRAHDLEVLQGLLGFEPRAAREELRAREGAKRKLTKVVETAVARLNDLRSAKRT